MRNAKYAHSRRWIARGMNKLIKELDSVPVTACDGRLGDVIVGLQSLVSDLQRRYIYDPPKAKTRKR